MDCGYLAFPVANRGNRPNIIAGNFLYFSTRCCSKRETKYSKSYTIFVIFENLKLLGGQNLTSFRNPSIMANLPDFPGKLAITDDFLKVVLYK